MTMMESADIGEPLPPEGRRPWRDQPSGNWPKGLSDDPDLVLQFQLVTIALAKLMDMCGVAELTIDAAEVQWLRMVRVETTEDESGRVICRMES